MLVPVTVTDSTPPSACCANAACDTNETAAVMAAQDTPRDSLRRRLDMIFPLVRDTRTFPDTLLQRVQTDGLVMAFVPDNYFYDSTLL
jgi:hypothetical protein